MQERSSPNPKLEYCFFLLLHIYSITYFDILGQYRNDPPPFPKNWEDSLIVHPVNCSSGKVGERLIRLWDPCQGLSCNF